MTNELTGPRPVSAIAEAIAAEPVHPVGICTEALVSRADARRLRCHGCSSAGWRLLLREVVAEHSHDCSALRSSGPLRLQPWHCSDAATRRRAIALTWQMSGRWGVRNRSACSLTVSTASFQGHVRSPKHSRGVARRDHKSDRRALGGGNPRNDVRDVPGRSQARSSFAWKGAASRLSGSLCFVRRPPAGQADSRRGDA